MEFGASEQNETEIGERGHKRRCLNFYSVFWTNKIEFRKSKQKLSEENLTKASQQKNRN